MSISNAYAEGTSGAPGGVRKPLATTQCLSGVHPDGSALVTMTNLQTERMHRLYHGAWTSQPMRMGTMPRASVSTITQPEDLFH